MLPDIHLDQITFEDMMEEAKNKIVSCYPEWTDFNYHDPGITLAELFAWRREIQQYEMDHVGDLHRRRYLRLLGADIRHRMGAEAYASAEGDAMARIPAGTRLQAPGMIFETEEYQVLPRSRIIKCFGFLEGKRISYLDSDQMKLEHSVKFCPFGREALPGTDFYILLDCSLPEGETLGLTVCCAKQDGAKRNPAEESTLPLARISCSCWDGSGYTPLKILKDETFGLLFEGTLFFQVDAKMISREVDGEEGYFLRLHLEESQYDTPPVLSFLSMKMLRVKQQETVATWLQPWQDEAHREILRVRHGLCARGAVRVFDFKEKYYREISIKEVHWDEERGEAEIRLEKEPEGKAIRVLVNSREDWYEEHGVLGPAHGFPDEQFSLDEALVCSDAFEILVEAAEHPGCYEPWERKEDFSYSGPEDKHYCLDSMNGRILFGDGFHGMPPEGQILLVSYTRVCGSGGNVKARKIQSFIDPLKAEIPVTNRKDAFGGADEESVEEAFIRVRRELAGAGSMVTAEDYESAVLSTPGLRIESCKALFGAEASGGRSEGEQIVQLVVKPGSLIQKPRLTPAMTENIRRHLEPRRLLGVRIRISSPIYIRIFVYLEVFVHPEYQDAEDLAERTVREYLSPMLTRFGGNVSYGGLYGQLDRLPGVSGVRSLMLEARGNGVKKNTYGDLLLPGNGIADEIEVQCSCSVRA